MISVNLLGTFFGIKYLTPFLKIAGKKNKFGSSIINLSSIAGLVGSRLDPLYSMSKGGYNFHEINGNLLRAKKYLLE